VTTEEIKPARGRESKLREKSGKQATFAKAALPRPWHGIEAMAEQLTNRANIELIVSRIRGTLGPGEVEDILQESFRESITAAGPHRTWLAEIDRISRNAASIDDLRDAISAYLRQAGIKRLDECSDESRFIISGSTGEEISVTQPAYIDTISGHTILTGHAERGERGAKMTEAATELPTTEWSTGRRRQRRRNGK
jgi:hypothetical protein